MLKRKLSTLILAATITNLVATPANVFAETLTQNNVIQADEVVEENQTRKILEILNQSKDLEEAKENVKALLNK